MLLQAKPSGLGYGLVALVISTTLVAGTPAAQLQFDRTPFDLSDRPSTKGASAARFVVVEFVDYQCPHCARYSREVLPKILKEFIETGRLRYIVVNLPLEAIHPVASKAAQAAECAGREGKFWEMHDLLLLNQKQLADTPLAKYATALKVDEARFNECLNTAATVPIVLTDAALAARMDIRGTPTFVFGELSDGRIYPLRKQAGAAPFPVMRSTIEDLLNGKMKR
jgi:protein-disulfide isomerase